MKSDSIILQARNAVQKERNEKTIEKLKVLYRQLADAEDVVESLKRKVALEESKVSE